MKQKYPFLSSSRFYPFMGALLGWFCVAFGQPAWFSFLGPLAATIGYALFFACLLDLNGKNNRFLIGTIWFTGIQLVQLSWLLGHPYWYIYAVWIFFSLLCGIQFGLFSLLITRKSIEKLSSITALTGIWVLFEWSRLFFLSGFSFNPAGMLLTGNGISIQMASLWGVFGLSFWVMLVNLLAVKAWTSRLSLRSTSLWAAAALTPYIYGFIHLAIHEPAFEEERLSNAEPYHAVLVQTAFPAEEALPFHDWKDMVSYTIEEWKIILGIIKKHQDQKNDLIALPEMVVPFGTYTLVFPYETVKEAFATAFGSGSLNALPPLAEPYAQKISAAWMVNNAFWLQGIANILQSDVIAGLEDAEDMGPGKREFYSAGIHFQPDRAGMTRYEKRVLVPMGEYIPFSFCKDLAACYGIQGSFTFGKEAKVMQGKIPFGVSICYEETFGDLMRENRQKGAKMLVNLTSDVWYTDSKLPQQHFDHAKLRTVENGIPLVRACNTGVTAVVDSLGREVAVLGKGDPEQERIADSIRVDIPKYTYHTVYTRFGDRLILSISLLAIIFGGYRFFKAFFSLA
jgi:apolipoprotein N-acyltransferase